MISTKVYTSIYQYILFDPFIYYCTGFQMDEKCRAEAQTRGERRAETQERHEWKTPQYSLLKFFCCSLWFLSFICSQDSIATSDGALVIARLQLATGIRPVGRKAHNESLIWNPDFWSSANSSSIIFYYFYFNILYLLFPIICLYFSIISIFFYSFWTIIFYYFLFFFDKNNYYFNDFCPII